MPTLPLSTYVLHYAPGSPPWRPPLLTTCCPSPYLCLLEENQPDTTPVIPTQDYPRAHKDPKEATKIYGSLRALG
ncbi:hypothetical protein E2C01_098279 [Portunus trituberculatus]|uniref:Uncharacterized protein n=1 Tax=Portunus trituberculatus TaxID=210409 RepID=A0A5B7K2M1_PORTR|nr:hypothetical protein [Portunus trituberculatus]